jgi:hypothetical protein
LQQQQHKLKTSEDEACPTFPKPSFFSSMTRTTTYGSFEKRIFRNIFGHFFF